MPVEASIKQTRRMNAIAPLIAKKSHGCWIAPDDLLVSLVFLIIVLGAAFFICDLTMRCLNNAENISRWLTLP
jgi:hypothetical protein